MLVIRVLVDICCIIQRILHIQIMLQDHIHDTVKRCRNNQTNQQPRK